MYKQTVDASSMYSKSPPPPNITIIVEPTNYVGTDGMDRGLSCSFYMVNPFLFHVWWILQCLPYSQPSLWALYLTPKDAPGGSDVGKLWHELLGGSQFSVLAPSRFGYLGSSQCSPTLSDQASAIVELLENLDLAKVAVIAIGAAGPLALEIARAYVCLSSPLVEPKATLCQGLWLTTIYIYITHTHTDTHREYGL